MVAAEGTSAVMLGAAAGTTISEVLVASSLVLLAREMHGRFEFRRMLMGPVLGSAVAGLRTCTVQDRAMTPRPVWNPDVDNPERFRDQWAPVPDNAEFDNGFKAQWELFLTAAFQGTPFRHDLFDGARGVQLALLALESARAGCRLPVPPLDER